MLAPEIPHLKAELALDRRALRAGLHGSSRARGAADRDRLRWIASCDRAELWREDGARHMAEWLSAQLHVSNWKARRWIDAAHALDKLPRISAALETGALSLDKTVELTRFATAGDEAKLLMWARRVTVARIRERGDELNRVDVTEIAEAHSARALWWNWDASKLRLDVQGYLAGDDAQRFVDAVDSLANEVPDTRAAERGPTELPRDADGEASLDQRRADALVLLVTSAGGDQVTKPTVVVHAPLSALGHDEGNCCTDNGDTLHPELVRKLTCDARLRFVLTDEDGNAVGIGRSSRTIPGWLRQEVLRRDGYRCTFPGCEMRRFLDIHHIKHWARGGATELGNLGTGCPAHHPLVHGFDWEMRLEDNRIAWYTPLGQRYEPGRAPPTDPDPPPERKPRPAEVAGYSRIFDLLKVL